MYHFFDVAIAKKYGINQAIILNHLGFWIEKNRANNKHYHDGKYWTYNSKKAFSELMPYMTERQITYALDKLEKEELIVKGNYNKSAYDRTLWYALTQKSEKLLNIAVEPAETVILQNCEMEKPCSDKTQETQEKSILQNCQMDSPDLSNQSGEIVRPIPDINTYKKPYNKKENNKEKNSEECLPEEEKVIEKIQAMADIEMSQKLLALFANRKRHGKPINHAVLKVIGNRLNNFSKGNRAIMLDILDRSISGGYTDVYPPKEVSIRATYPVCGAYNIDEYEETTADNYEDYLNSMYDTIVERNQQRWQNMN